MGKKNLEQLFKKTFEGFQEVPDDKVWNSIEASLDKKKQKKRMVPLWWQLGGVAALVAVLLYIINPFESVQQQTDSIVTDTETQIEPSAQEEQIDPSSITNGTESLVETSSETQEGENQDMQGSSVNANQSFTSNQQQVANNDGAEKGRIQKQEALPSSQNKEEVAALASSDKREENLANAISEGDKAIANDNSSDKATQKEALQNVLEQQKEEAVAANEEKQDDEGKSIFDAIKEEEEEEVIVDNTSGKWSVGPSVAPVYFSASGKGSPIHSDFASNSKSGNLNLSYGLSVAYEIGKKLKIRSGVHRVNYGYDTNDVLFSSSARNSSSAKLANIDYDQKAETLVVQSKNSLPNNIPTDAFLELSSNEIPVLDGKMVQQLGYIEVPVELNYAVIDKKFGVDLIGGVSSLFLVENSVLVESEGLVTEVGEATNANDVNFSANFGMGLNYDFSPKVQLSVEPVFKYQMNTFSKTAGEFQPFSIGIYSGVSFKF
ncbi:outer membrane beta-barrel protein [Muricauda sp. CAU 1633]|uniref:outer membrane beta-barrel protein n=1 Tax=Allomuricauda sp. CAU 1633 TaxID=2816036 RepID=UPI001A8EE516|nr:outer membrane beta-barrel protein [Muricauda sp. CAU 1633]MBO0320926.1 outer membrane beta-barrel protein [Muricauda sp. CAU 1633]